MSCADERRTIVPPGRRSTGYDVEDRTRRIVDRSQARSGRRMIERGASKRPA
jgi:hypothetical protein